MRCAIGRGGVTTRKREGDGATPIGHFRCRWLYWRADRVAEPTTALARRPLTPRDGWCDDPASACYNRYLELPHTARHERLWREDALYDLLVMLGHNDLPVVQGHGSAIFLHLAAPDFAPTAGCIALASEDLRHFLTVADAQSSVVVER